MSVALLGYGTVGSGVARVLEALKQSLKPQMGAAPELKYIVELREIPAEDSFSALQIKDVEIAFKDPEVDIVVECIGGSGIANDLTRRAIQAGKNVVTSNKAMVAAYGREILELARTHHVRYLFEASVGGGIPVIHTQKYCLAANRIERIGGILNGTTNYILEQMENHGLSFDTALQEAQRLGYAEADPSADIDGLDTGRKITILSCIADQRFYPFEQTLVEGIRQVTPLYFKVARQYKAKLKLLALCDWDQNGQPGIKTALHLLPEEHPLNTARGVMNAVYYRCSALGETMFYGPGAGSMPTASAVVSDILEAIREPLVAGQEEHWQSGGEQLLRKTAGLPVSACLFKADQSPVTAEEANLLAAAAAVHAPADAHANSDTVVCYELNDSREACLADLLDALSRAADWRCVRKI